MLVIELDNAIRDFQDRVAYFEKGQVIVRIEGKDYQIIKAVPVVSKGDYGTLELLCKQNEDNNMLDKNFNKLDDEYGKEAIVEILMRRDSMSEEEAKELIAQFEEELSEMVEEDRNKDKGFTYGLYQIEETFSDYFGLEPDYLFCFLNDVLAKESE